VISLIVYGAWTWDFHTKHYGDYGVKYSPCAKETWTFDKGETNWRLVRAIPVRIELVQVPVGKRPELGIWWWCASCTPVKWAADACYVSKAEAIRDCVNMVVNHAVLLRVKWGRTDAADLPPALRFYVGLVEQVTKAPNGAPDSWVDVK